MLLAVQSEPVGTSKSLLARQLNGKWVCFARHLDSQVARRIEF